MAEASGASVGSKIMDKLGIRGFLTIFRCCFEAIKGLKDALVVLLVVIFIFSVWYLHLFLILPERHCVLKGGGKNLTSDEIRKYNKDNINWLKAEDGSPQICGMGSVQVCPMEYDCVDVTEYHVLEYDIFPNIFASYTAVLVVALSDFWEISYQKVVLTKGKWNTVFFLFLIMISYCVVTFTLGVASMAFSKIWQKDNATKDKDAKTNKGETDRSKRLADIPFIDNGEVEVTLPGDTAPQNAFQKCYDVSCGWQCCDFCDNLKHVVHRVIFDPFTQIATVMILILQAGILISDRHNMDEELLPFMSIGNIIFHFFFTVEAICKIIALSPKGYFSESWNLFEFLIVVLGLLDMILEMSPLLGLAYLFKIFRLARFWPSYELSIKLGLRVFKIQLQFIVIIGTFILLLACAGMYIHGEDYEKYKPANAVIRWHMMDFGHSFLVVFRALCGEWVESLSDCAEFSGYGCIPLYVAIMVLGKFILINLFTIFLLSGFASSNDQESKTDEVTGMIQIMSDGADRFLNAWEWVQLKLGFKEIQSDRVALGQTLNGDTSSRDGLAGENVTYVRLDEEINPATGRTAAGPCCPPVCNKCIPDSNLQCWTTIRGMCHFLTQNRFFELTTIIFILIFTVLLALDDVYMNDKSEMKTVVLSFQASILVYIAIEMIVRLIGHGCVGYFKSGWRTLDFIVAMLALISLILSVSGIASVPFLKALGATRLLRVLALTWKFEAARVVFNTIFVSVPAMLNFFLIGFMEWLIFAIIGVQLFAGRFYACYDFAGENSMVNASFVPTYSHCVEKNLTWINNDINFDHIINGFLALTQIATFKGWIDIMHKAADSTTVYQQPIIEGNLYMFTYFVIFIIFCSYFTYVMWFSVLIDGYNSQRDETARQRKLSAPGDYMYYSIIKNISAPKQEISRTPNTQNKLLAMMQSCVTSPIFDIVVSILIALNVLVLACHHNKPTMEALFAWQLLDIFFLIAFTIELVMRIELQRTLFFRNTINIIDLVAILLSLISIAFKDVVSSYIIAPMLLRLIRLTEIAYKRKWTRKFTGFNKIMSALTKSLPFLLVISSILAIIIIIYAVIGMALFKDVSRVGEMFGSFNFETFGNSLTVLCQIFIASGWDGILKALIDENSCDLEHNPNGCVDPMPGVIYTVSFVMISHVAIFTTLTVIILELYHESGAQTRCKSLLDICTEGFYHVWARYDPSFTGFIQLKELPGLLDQLVEPMRVAKPNDAKITAMDIPLMKGDKVNHLDVLDAVYRNVLAAEGMTVNNLENFECLPHAEAEYEPVSSTLWRKRETQCAHIIQRTWSRYKQRTRV